MTVTVTVMLKSVFCLILLDLFAWLSKRSEKRYTYIVSNINVVERLVSGDRKLVVICQSLLL